MRLARPRTIFSKLFLVLFLAGVTTQILIGLTIVLFIEPRPHAQQAIQANVDKYLRYLGDDLARDPSLAHAEDVLHGTWFDARSEGAAVWQTRKVLPDVSRVPASEDFAVIEGRPLFRLRRETRAGPVDFTLFGPPGPPLSQAPSVFLLLASIILIIFVVASTAVYRVLRPITLLSGAFRTVGEGKLDISVPVGADDELGRLSRSFNEMAAQIRHLLDDKQQLLLEISHEFRAPLARVSAASGLIEDEALQDSIHRAIKELDGLIEALVTSARMEAGKSERDLEEVDLPALVTEVAEKFSTASGRIDLELPPSPIIYRANQRSLSILVKNLIENALKYSPAEEHVQVRLEQTAQSVVLSVRDHGQGIPADELPRVFEPFFRGSGARTAGRSGFGLGLGLCRRIVQAHRGDLRLESQVGAGTTARVVLPLAA